MRRNGGWAIVLAVLIGGCDNPAGPDPQPSDRFGAVTAVIDGRAWVSSYFPDSTIGFYEPGTGRLQITGQELLSDLPRTLHLFVVAGPGPGAWVFGASADQVVGQLIEPEPVRPRYDTGLRGFQSTGSAGDSLVIEELDLTTRVLRGRFSFLARDPHSGKEVRVTGRFAGRVLLPGT